VAISKCTKELAVSRHGHAVVIRALAKASSQTLGCIESALVENLEALIDNDFGFRVIQAALQFEQDQSVPARYSRVARFVNAISFKAEQFKFIEYLVLHFPNHASVRNVLLPNIVRFVQERSSLMDTPYN